VCCSYIFCVVFCAEKYTTFCIVYVFLIMYEFFAFLCCVLCQMNTYLVPRRVPPHTLGLVPSGASGGGVVVEAELAHEESRHSRCVARVRRLVPHLHHELAHHHVPAIHRIYTRRTQLFVHKLFLWTGTGLLYGSLTGRTGHNPPRGPCADWWVL
jgi:hypothetical protein